ncbi:SGNH/GDSL hydrolase family protein [Azospirillum sp. SYSU D00513]|uniref:SGNH/GDSL hydrolase family protein n=1 Tax=Azospirillum sp. SYSU D00513 TaxID=2812561 RepID=UPI001A96A7A0|nr:SGNH/GDSL hydrolase family protein [Azospirillum sp. SYSU D00513]
MPHAVLLGDSIFDNAAYVGGGPDVIRHLRQRLPAEWQATLCAVDGAVTNGVARQLDRIPADASHLVVSVGGNDALGYSSVLEEGARSVAGAVNLLADIRERFQRDYRAMVEAVLARRLPTALCTVYDARYPDPLRHRLVVTGLTVFNDVITREAFARGLPLLDLRLICDEAEDYANPIEPSVQGGGKIAASIVELVTAPWPQTHSVVIAR